MNSDNYDHVLDVLIEAVRELGEVGMTRQDVLPALVDFVAAVGLILGEEEGARAVLARIERRISEWQSGQFPRPEGMNRPVTVASRIAQGRPPAR